MGRIGSQCRITLRGSFPTNDTEMAVTANAQTILLGLQWDCLTIRDQAFHEALGQSVGSEKSGKPRGWFGNVPVGEGSERTKK
jgi:hypothetical protein